VARSESSIAVESTLSLTRTMAASNSRSAAPLRGSTRAVIGFVYLFKQIMSNFDVHS
jgi:hypothetical protein